MPSVKVSFILSIIAFLVFYYLSINSFHEASIVVSSLLSCFVFYFLITGKNRREKIRMMNESSEAILFASNLSTLIGVTKSLPRSLLLLPEEELSFKQAIARAKKEILLGIPPEKAVSKMRDSFLSKTLTSYLDSLLVNERAGKTDEGEEYTSILSLSSMSSETKVPVFVSVSFFSPILLTLYSVIAKLSTFQEYIGLCVLCAFMLDVAFLFSRDETYEKKE